MTEDTPPNPKILKRRILTKTPKRPSAAQFKEARKNLGPDGWSREIVANVSRELGLPVDVNAIRQIEAGKKAGKPTKWTDKGNYRSDFAFCRDMLYDQRLHLVYLMLGCIFLPEDKVAKADPADLWGALAELDEAWPHPFAGTPVDILNASEEKNPDHVDLAREFIKRAYNRAKRI